MKTMRRGGGEDGRDGRRGAAKGEEEEQAILVVQVEVREDLKVRFCYVA